MLPLLVIVTLNLGQGENDDVRVPVPTTPFECRYGSSFRFDKSGSKLTGLSGNGELLAWRDDDEKPFVLRVVTKPDDAPMSAVLTASSSEVALFFYDGRVQVWNTEPGVKVKDLECDRKNLSYGNLSADGRFAACLSRGGEGETSTILFWNTRDWTSAGRIETPDQINDYCFTADEKQVIACVGHPTDLKELGFTGIVAWDLASKKEESRIEYGSGFPVRIAVSADGRWVATGGGDAVPIRKDARELSGHLRVFDWQAKKFQKELYTLDSDYVRAVQFSPNSQSLYSGCYSIPPGGGQSMSVVRAHHTGDWTSQWEASLGTGNPHEITVSPNGKDLLVPDNEALHIVNAKDGTVRGAKLTFRFLSAR